MKKSLKTLMCLMLILGILASMAGCGGDSATGIMDNGAERFAQGKDEENYSLRNSGALLEALIDDFSGSYQNPTSSQMDQDDFDDAKKRADAAKGSDTEPDSTTPSGETVPGETQPAEQILQVSSWDDLKRAFYSAYSETSEYLEFEVVGGFSVDLTVDLEKAFRELQREDPIYVGSVESWTWGVQGNQYLIEIKYTMDVDELIRIKDATEALVEEAVDVIDGTGMSDYEIVCAVNEYLCDTVYYPPNEPYAPMTHTAYGALADGVAVCEGYACAAKLLLNRFGILCDIQIGTCTNGGGHAWNLVQLEDQWYQMDVTWNDGSASRTDYLLVTDDYMLKSRTWDTSDYPACAPTAYQP